VCSELLRDPQGRRGNLSVQWIAKGSAVRDGGLSVCIGLLRDPWGGMGTPECALGC
jgi:hypothetical protein